MVDPAIRETVAIVRDNLPEVCDEIYRIQARDSMQTAWEDEPSVFQWWWLDQFVTDRQECQRYRAMLFAVDRYMVEVSALCKTKLPDEFGEALKRKMISAAFPTLGSLFDQAKRAPASQCVSVINRRIARDRWLRKS